MDIEIDKLTAEQDEVPAQLERRHVRSEGVFSSRVPRDAAPNAWARRLAELRAAGRELIDLTEANPDANRPERDRAGGARRARSGACRRRSSEPYAARSARAAIGARSGGGLLRRAAISRSIPGTSCSRPGRARATRICSDCSPIPATRCSCPRRAIRCSSRSPRSRACRCARTRSPTTGAGTSISTALERGLAAGATRRGRGAAESPDRHVSRANARSRRSRQAVRASRRRDHRRRGLRRFRLGWPARRSAEPGGRASRAHVRAERIVEGVRAAATQARLDLGRRAGRRARSRADRPGLDRRSVSERRERRSSSRYRSCWPGAARSRRARSSASPPIARGSPRPIEQPSRAQRARRGGRLGGVRAAARAPHRGATGRSSCSIAA